MMGIDPVYTSTLIPFLRELLRNWFAVSPVGFDAAGDTVFLPIVATLVLLAGLSEALGTHSVALFGNRVRRQTFYISMLVYAVCFLLGSVVWVGVSWLLAAHVFHIHQSIHVLAVVIGFSYLPRLFAC